MMPKSTAQMRPSLSTNRFPGCRSAWKKPSRSAWVRNVRSSETAICFGIVAGRAQVFGIAQRRAVDPFGGQHARRGARPIERGHAEFGIVAHVLREFGGGGAFHAQIELERHRSRERIDEIDGPQAARFGGEPLGQHGGEPERPEVLREARFDAGAQDLHRDAARRIVGGRRPDGLARSKPPPRAGRNRRTVLAPAGRVGLDDAAGFDVRERRQAVLQRFQPASDIGAEDIGTRRQELAQLDRGGSQLFQGLREPPAGRKLRVAALARAEQPGRDAQRDRHARGVFARQKRIIGGKRARHADQNGDVLQCTEHHAFQPECIAAMPPERLRCFTCAKPAFSIIFANVACGGKRRMLSAR